jgi:hypothetical protein
MMRNKFAVIKLWPKLKAAEDEVIARMKITARSLGLECLEVDSFARLVQAPFTQLTQEDVDFVISLHFETPKRYDIFSFVTLWNPLKFYHEWGYRRFTNHLLTHDDFLSCSSSWADDQIRRCISSDPMREGPELSLYHSLSEPIYEPTVGDRKLFYTGINWDRLGKGRSRHQELLELLDKSGTLRIYGPKIFGGIDVWEGFKSYVGPVPFDGVSMVREINKAGISLVLSSEAHRQSELMSSRLFESLAAGAVIICDENPFARRYFGDTLLHIDTRLPVDEVCAQVHAHLDWVKANPSKALELAGKAQEIFRQRFTMDGCLKKIYQEFPARKERLECLYKPKRPEETVSVLFLMPEFQPDILERHISSCLAQKHVKLNPVLVMDTRDAELFERRVKRRLADLPIEIGLEAVDFFDRVAGGTAIRRRTGTVVHEAIAKFAGEDYLCLVGPNERLFSDHLCSLLRVLQDFEELGAAWSTMLVFATTNGEEKAEENNALDFDNLAADPPIGIGRFLFRVAALPPDLGTTLPYLDGFAMHLLAGVTTRAASKRCTLMLDQDRNNVQFSELSAKNEREILADYSPALFCKKVHTDGPAPAQKEPEASNGGTSGKDLTVAPQLSEWIEQMSPEEKTKLAVILAHSVPIPEFLKKIGFGAYRIWFRATR